MERRTKVKNNQGITLIALVISIIVMLILAGVSLNAVVGQNGVLTQAQNATIANRKAQILEELNLELTSYNVDTITGNSEETKTMLGNLISKGLVDTVLSSDSTYKTTADSVMGIPNFDGGGNYTGFIDYAVKKDDYQIIISIDDSGIYQADYGIVNIGSGGSVSAGTTLVTANAFDSGEGVTNPADKGKFTIDDDASVMFVDEVSGELSILVKAGKHAKVSIFKNMTLTNAGIKRSAIDIESGGTLDLYVAPGATVTVNSGLGENATGNTPGKGGYAGIHVPSGATLNLKGEGTVKAYAGKAGVGGDPTGNDAPSAGGGGAGAGIGGNGGDGGKGTTNVGNSGGTGGACGSINIYNKVTVWAFGGDGGSGGKANSASSGGGGGYPGAGIGGGGGGGAGGTCCAGGGGYTGGNGEGATTRKYNGLSGEAGNPNGITSIRYLAGGGYFQGGAGTSSDTTPLDRAVVALGGVHNHGWYENDSHRSGYGGNGGTGGTIKASGNSTVYAFNGNLYSNGTDYQNGINQCPIYAHYGAYPAKYYCDCTNQDAGLTFKMNLTEAAKTITKSGYTNYIYISTSTKKVDTYVAKRTINFNTILGTNNSYIGSVDMSLQGVGSGAGYKETSNGTYTTDNTLN